MNHNLKWEKIILNVSFIGSILFLLAEIIMAVITHSNAVFMDCIFDVADLIMIGPFLVLIPLLYQPVTEKRPYGFAQLESLFIMIKSSILIIITFFLIISSIQVIINGGNEVDAGAIAIFEIIISITCIIMYFLLSKLKKKYTSPSIEAELYIWKLDSLSTMGVGIAFVIKLLLDKTSLSSIGPYVDPGIAIILAILLLKEPIGLLIESIKNLILFSPDETTNERIKDICIKHLEEHDCYLNFIDIIKTGRKLWIEVYFVVDKDLISISKIKKIHHQIQKSLSNEFESIDIELIPDIEEIKRENKEKMKANRRPDKINYVHKVNNKKEIKKTKKIEKKSKGQ